MKQYELIEHTADVGVKAYGKTVAEAFEHAAEAMFDIITDESMIDPIGEYDILLEAPDLEQLLVDWLSKLLFLNGAENLVFGKFQVTIDANRLSARVFGEKYNNKKHKMGVEIKAVTYHILQVNEKDPIFVQVLFDI
ncbi:MAG: archease [Thermoplasmata archaeon]|nr:archease [Thermoplasmata archaeon]MBE3137188.1 archease [Thermoplasmata archaeon]MBE3140496.1 archease [Thermoplasmata archaeon]